MTHFVPSFRLTATTDTTKPAKPAVMRRYEIQFLDDQGAQITRNLVGPANPTFEKCFAGMARGTVIETTQGPFAVEDLVPGDRIETLEYGALPLLWRGSINLISGTEDLDADSQRVTRISAETFGIGKPSSDLLLGAGVQINRAPDAKAMPKLVCPRDIEDGETITSVAPSVPVQVFHIGLPRQATFRANGIPLVSAHPGSSPHHMRYSQRQTFMSLFPHIATIDGFGSELAPQAKHPTGCTASPNLFDAESA